MLLFSMNGRTVVNIATGEKIGSLSSCNLKVDEETGTIEAILLPKSRLSALFARDESDYTEIPWQNIKKIGIDTIIVEI
ncbi:MAG: YlmC/YmxH family sporulation protein [Eubacteriaceae bacterium]|nr:YlmC/YmxH family sporulation protein [Eubacteriaceae bacterium]